MAPRSRPSPSSAVALVVDIDAAACGQAVPTSPDPSCVTWTISCNAPSGTAGSKREGTTGPKTGATPSVRDARALR